MRATLNGLTFNSDFDSGNLASVEDVSKSPCEEEYLCTVRSDCEGTPHATTNSSWFYFEVAGGQRGRVIRLHIKTQNAQIKLYGYDMRPVVRVGEGGKWTRIPTRPETAVAANQETFVISWMHCFECDAPVSFAFTYPYSSEELSSSILVWERKAKQNRIVFERSVAGKSLEGRDLTVLKITSSKGKESDKQIVLLSARVHPGETPGSHMLHGLIDLLVRNDSAIAQLLRTHFIFKIVPMLNPDGVVNGHYRSDTLGVNLNRMYESPKIDKHPTILAMKKLFLMQHATGRLMTYIDFHAHATKRGCFMYGNAHIGEKYVENLLFPTLLSLNCEHFDIDACNFTLKNMKTKGKKDGLSKQGTGRVALYRETGMVQCYTLEANYNRGLPTDQEPCPPPYTIEMFRNLGEAVGVSLLDMIRQNPNSVLPSTPYQNLSGLRSALARSANGKRPGGSAARRAAPMATTTAASAAAQRLLGKRVSALPTITKSEEPTVLRVQQACRVRKRAPPDVSGGNL